MMFARHERSMQRITTLREQVGNSVHHNHYLKCGRSEIYADFVNVKSSCPSPLFAFQKLRLQERTHARRIAELKSRLSASMLGITDLTPQSDIML